MLRSWQIKRDDVVNLNFWFLFFWKEALHLGRVPDQEVQNTLSFFLWLGALLDCVSYKQQKQALIDLREKNDLLEKSTCQEPHRRIKGSAKSSPPGVGPPSYYSHILQHQNTNHHRSPEVRSSRPAWPTWRNPIYTKNTKHQPGMVDYRCL